MNNPRIVIVETDTSFMVYVGDILVYHYHGVVLQLLQKQMGDVFRYVFTHDDILLDMLLTQLREEDYFDTRKAYRASKSTHYVVGIDGNVKAIDVPNTSNTPSPNTELENRSDS